MVRPSSLCPRSPGPGKDWTNGVRNDEKRGAHPGTRIVKGRDRESK